ncbi:MAG: aldehyde dehydrogenase family protein [Candidatus Omnitrophica bacterium]|nr:aldehyde dehydrogenase family protein [Candidatus Omnitrophota bacterium]
MNTPKQKLEFLLQKQKAYSVERPFPSASQRREHLLLLERTIIEQTDNLLDALHQDLGKCPVEAYTSEVGLVLRDIRFAVKKLKKWMKPQHTRNPLFVQPGRAYVKPAPLGVVLIIGPWNYPFQLLFSPLAAALAAGNAVCLKPSEFAPAASRVIHDICRACFPEEQVSVVQGDHQISADLATLPFDHIFFTGSAKTGRLVAQAAASNLIPVTLELGGKSPCVVCDDAPLKKTARRILWGKSLNAGQTCVAPDHIWVHHSIEQDFLNELKHAARSLTPVRPPDLKQGDYSRIINHLHYDRLEKLLEGTTIYDGGERDRETLIFAPAILTNVDPSQPVMQEEIFGPVLPVLPFRSFDDVMQEMYTRPTPLAAYLFTRDRKTMQIFEEHVQAGGICINDSVSHILPPDLPFGGLGASGYGSYHGRAGFDRLSHAKPILRRGFTPDLPFRYPPYAAGLSMIKKAFQFLAG